MVDGKHALVVVACVAGFGAWGVAFHQDVENSVTYASELFGATSDSRIIQYPHTEADDDGDARQHPMVILTAKAPNTDGDGGVVANTLGAGEVGEVMFSLNNGAQFGETVGSDALIFQTNAGADAGTVTIVDGGAKGDSSVTFGVTVGETALGTGATLTFKVPRLQNLSALGAGHIPAIGVSVSTRRTGGPGRLGGANVHPFPTGSVETFNGTDVDFNGVVDEADDNEETPPPVGNTCPKTMPGECKNIVSDANAVTLDFNGGKAAIRTGDESTRIQIDGRSMLVANSWGDVLRGDEGAYDSNSVVVEDMVAAPLGDLVLTISKAAADGSDILQWDGTVVDNDVAGVLNVNVSGDFNEGDAAFVNFNERSDFRWDGYGERAIDDGEALTLNAAMTSFSFTTGGLSIDPDDVEDGSNATRHLAVYYIPAGKVELAHGSIISMSAMINYTPSTAMDEEAKSSKTELRYHGVAGAIQAYAIPFEGNGKGDTGNVRIRCEAGDAFSKGMECRAFLECWDDMGMRSFGEIDPRIAAKGLETIRTGAIEMVVGVEDPSSRHSCRVLATGRASVQVLVRDGTSGTLVNNTHVNN